MAFGSLVQSTGGVPGSTGVGVHPGAVGSLVQLPGPVGGTGGGGGVQPVASGCFLQSTVLILPGTMTHPAPPVPAPPLPPWPAPAPFPPVPPVPPTPVPPTQNVWLIVVEGRTTVTDVVRKVVHRGPT